MMQKAFIFWLIILISLTFASGNRRYNVQFSLGCPAVIPCHDKRSDSNSFKWFYKKDEDSKKKQIFFEDKTGVQHHHVFGRKGSVRLDRSLVIHNFTENDQGLYWCENCYQGICNNERSTVITVKKEILDEIQKTFYVTAGGSFTHECPGKFTNLQWTFEANNTAALSAGRSKPDLVTSNKSIHIVNIKRANAGKYTCWLSRCNGRKQKLLTINLCVITGHQSEESSVSCTVICNVDSSNTKSYKISNEDPYGSLNTVNSTHAPSNASNKATDTLTEPEYLTPVIYGTSAALACFILMALLIFCSRKILRAAFCNCPSGCGSDDRLEEETSVVYSSVVIRRPAKTRNIQMTSSVCVYSEIKV